ncbi:hypothetical protein GCM10011507_34600 [Edaphobacter acidisoli]|uniref:Uncharacterized protein n=1 Tax=Edaphobacter acidisoli TaxID=2040573 RepID=A0A916S4A8_9BACT|nr:hypothetical protein GCM10011507_34600 [Edaphobacter acidisoli]
MTKPLGLNTVTCVIDLLRRYFEKNEEIRVSDKVGNTRNNWAELIEPVPESEPKATVSAKRTKPGKEPAWTIWLSGMGAAGEFGGVDLRAFVEAGVLNGQCRGSSERTGDS